MSKNHPADGAPSAGFWRSPAMNADDIIFFLETSGRSYNQFIKFYSRCARARGTDWSGLTPSVGLNQRDFRSNVFLHPNRLLMRHRKRVFHQKLLLTGDSFADRRHTWILRSNQCSMTVGACANIPFLGADEGTWMCPANDYLIRCVISILLIVIESWR